MQVFGSLFSLFLEILNDCSDVDEIKFQEDGTWCPMRPKKEAVKVSSQSVPKIESKYIILELVLSTSGRCTRYEKYSSLNLPHNKNNTCIMLTAGA